MSSFIALDKDVETYGEKDDIEPCWKLILCENYFFFSVGLQGI